MPMDMKGPLIYDSLDRPNAPDMGKKPTPKPSRDPWVLITLIVAAFLLILFAVIYILSWAHSAVYYSQWAALALTIVQGSIVVAIVGSIIALVLYLILLAANKGIWSLDKGVPLSVIGALKEQVEITHAMNLQYQVLLKRAEQSRFQGVQTLTLDESTQTDTSTTTVAPVTDEPVAEDVIGRDKSPLEDLRDKGLINRSDNSLMIGFSAEG